MNKNTPLEVVDSDIYYCYNRIGRSTEMIERLMADTTDSKAYGQWLESVDHISINQILLRERNKLKYWTTELTKLIERRQELTLINNNVTNNESIQN